YKLDLTPTVFFEYATAYAFAAYLSEEYPNAFTVQTPVKAEQPLQPVEKNIKNMTFSAENRFPKPSVTPVQKEADHGPEPIAIVGMSGVFPKAKDIEEYWKNLKAGVDCITEVPKDRWDWQEYYGDP
ncbi:hypothetical protein JO861_24810, partial [Rhodococcus hoagii]|nr:hypothetical protein [Prescottella equi]